MTMIFRPAEPRDAKFLGWACVTATRSQLSRGWFDIVLRRDDAFVFEFAKHLTQATARSWCHWSLFHVAEVDGVVASAMCGFGDESVYAASAAAMRNGGRVPFDRLLLATGVEPVRPSIPGADQPHVHTLRSLADCRAIIEGAKAARCVVILGASFIGLEVAASLRSRGIETHVVAPDQQPMRRILGPDMGNVIRRLHTDHGVIFHLEETARAIKGKLVELKGGRTIKADLVVAGIGVRPRVGLAVEPQQVVSGQAESADWRL